MGLCLIGIGKYQLSNILGMGTCTHVLYAYAILDPTNYTMQPFDTELDLTSGNYQQFVALKVPSKNIPSQ
jgi:hypothetical protein